MATGAFRRQTEHTGIRWSLQLPLVCADSFFTLLLERGAPGGPYSFIFLGLFQRCTYALVGNGEDASYAVSSSGCPEGLVSLIRPAALPGREGPT